jgi:hypothetical protein
MRYGAVRKTLASIFCLMVVIWPVFRAVDLSFGMHVHTGHQAVDCTSDGCAPASDTDAQDCAATCFISGILLPFSQVIPSADAPDAAFLLVVMLIGRIMLAFRAARPEADPFNVPWRRRHVASDILRN